MSGWPSAGWSLGRVQGRWDRDAGAAADQGSSGQLSALEKICQCRSFTQRRDAAIIAVLTATGIRAGELAGIRYDAGDPRRSDVDLWRREITVRGKGGRARVVRIGVFGGQGCVRRAEGSGKEAA